MEKYDNIFVVILLNIHPAGEIGSNSSPVEQTSLPCVEQNYYLTFYIFIWFAVMFSFFVN